MRIRRPVLDAIIAHARSEAPFECCGLLIGREDLIDGSRPAANLRRSATRFLVDPAAHFTAIRDARRTGRFVIAAYHSHPGSPPAPSPADLAECHDPDLLQVIVSLAAPEPAVRAWRLEGNGLEVELLVEG